MTWVYIKSEPQLWTAGFYGPSGKWHPESDHGTPDEAALRVHYLNGGGGDDEDDCSESLAKEDQRNARYS